MAHGIDEKNGTVNVHELLPDPGDSVMIVNCGDYYEVRHHKWSVGATPAICLTDEDIEHLKQGSITWN
jgi:hypothetical protein